MQKITTFMMFEGKAEEAINFYISVFPSSRIDKLVKYGAEPKGMAGKIVHADFILSGQSFMAMDNASGRPSSFTPSFSLYVQCQTEQEIDAIYKKLIQGGSMLMEYQKYPFAEKYAWLADKYGISWQLFLNTAK